MRGRLSLGFCLLVALLTIGAINGASTASAAPVTLTGSHPYGVSWDNGAYWSDGLPAQAGNDYYVGAGMRTPNNASNPVFPGDSLTVYAGGTIGTKHNGTATFANLFLGGGAINTAVGNRTMSIGGTITVLSDSRFDAAGTNNRTLVIASQLAGSGDLRITGNSGNGIVRLTNATNTYSGNWNVASGVLQAQGAGSLGSGNATVASGGQLDVDYNLTTAGSLDLAGSMVLDQNLTVSALTIGGAVLAPGSYDYAFLNATYDSYFADGGSGSIFVGTAYELNATQPYGTSWNDGSYWTNIGDGTTGVVPAAGTAANVDGFVLRAPTSSDTFDARLNLQAGSNMYLKANNGTATLVDGHLLGGSINQAIAPNSTGTLAGNLAVDSDSSLVIGSKSGDVRTMILAADLSGAGQLTVDGGDGGGAPLGTLRLTGNNSAYSGNWLLSDNALLKAENAGSLGAGSVTVQGGSRLDVDYDVNTGGSLDLAGSMVLDQNHTVNALSVGGSAFALGTFDFAFLNTYFDNHFVDGGSGSITTTSGVAAGTVYELNAGQPMGTSWNSGSYWTNTGDNSTGVVPAAGTIANVNGRGLRTPTSSDTFGATLNLMAGSALGLKTNGTATLADAHLQGATLNMSVGGTGTIAGNIVVESNSSVNLASTGSDHRTMILAADLSGSGGLNVRGSAGYGTLRLTGDNSAYSGDWVVRDFARVQTETDGALGSGAVTLNNSGRLQIQSIESIAGLTGNDSAEMRIGYNASGSLTVAPGTVTFGTAANPGNIYVGNRGSGGSGNYAGVLDLSGSTFTANLTNFDLGTSRSGANAETAQGIVTLGTTNTITADRLLISDSTASNQSGLGTASVLHLGNVNNFAISTVTVGGRKGEATVDIVAGGTLDLTSSSGGRANLYVGRNNLNTGTTAQGTLDLSGGASFNALLDNLILGQKTSGGSGKAVGRITLADSNVIDANTVLLGSSDNGGQTDAAQQQQLILGSSNTLDFGTFTIGSRKSTALVAFGAGGGTLQLGQIAPGEIRIGYNDVNSGSVAVGVFDTTGGTADVAATQIILGHKSGGGTGSAIGDYFVGDGSTDVSGDIHETGDGGTSTIRVLGNHTFTVGGYIAVDSFTVGLNGVAGSATFAGTTAQIGTAAQPTDLIIGRRTSDTGTTFQGTLDLSGLTTFTATLDELLVGTATGGSGGLQGQPRGVVTLAANNVIDARSIVIGDSPSVGLGGFNSRVILGTANTITADTLIVGGNKSSGDIGGSLQFGAGGGVLDLGTPGDPVDVFVGWQTVGTGGGAAGYLDMTGGTFNASIDQWVIGTKPDAARGTTKGIVDFSDGTVAAASIVLGERTNAGSQGAVQGTFNLAGGELTAGSIAKGAGNGNNANDRAVFNWTGGTLHVDTFGSSADPFDLVQDGGTLAPGDPTGVMNVFGNYTQNDGIFEVEIGGLAQGADPGYDFVDVSGTAVLDGSVLPVLSGGFTPTLGDVFDVLTATSIDLGTNFQLDQSQLDPRYAYFSAEVIPGGNGEILRLSYVPEPSSIILALLGGLALLGVYRRRRSR
ncbi:MAG: PEP-CTERM sorting domain-containing protein [Planctomycetes bacterium]|nr:PEP-CTERM sorting domain-containing protein [Planctomycetota bacterium]